MIFSPLDDISFDKDDANLFQVDDARLRADALKHSIVPRLRVVMNEAIALIRDIYGIDALEDSSFNLYPNFSEKSYNGNILHDWAMVGLGGQRKAKWPGFSRWDHKPVQMLPFRFNFALSYDGLQLIFENGVIEGLRSDSYITILQFHIEHEELINRLCFSSRISPFFYYEKELPYFATFKRQYLHRIKRKRFDNAFIGYTYKFPVGEDDLYEIIYDFAYFFPVYDAYIQMAKGLPHRLDTLVDSLEHFYQETEEIAEEESKKDSKKKDLSLLVYCYQETEKKENSEKETPSLLAARSYAKAAAASKIPVMPAMRWRVFQRDGWKCVACGRTSHDGAILHVDHIVPRSKGGPDTLENFQTLCETCNIGKSNRDDTDLRRRR